MTLTSGTRLGPYEVVAAIGAGGMGEVYRAKDTKLGRDVAIKVLPTALAQDVERLARFEREARLLASLNHTNIAHVYGFESATLADGTTAHFLAMELVEGEDLAERLKGGAILLDESLAMARQLAEGLEEAHEHGIIHRDLKPANIKVTPEGKVKILDFGLAKAWEADPSGSGAGSQLSHSPTISRHMTEAGVILGTAAYMSPEQARGKPIDKRADIWSFGVVLYEMLTGERLFGGETVSDVLVAVLSRDADLNTLPDRTPAEVRQLLRRCLDRNVKNRLHDAGDARITLEDVLSGRRDGSPIEAASEEKAPGRSRRTLLAGIAAALAIGLGVGYLARGGSGESPHVTFERLTFAMGHFTNARFAPDGQTVFYGAGWDGNPREIYQSRPQAGELALGVRAFLLSVSASGELAVLLRKKLHSPNPYLEPGTLAIVSASGGTPRELADDVLAADWAPDGKTIAVLKSSGQARRIEYPLGTVIYQGEGINGPRVSPDGEKIAFFQGQGGEVSVRVVGRDAAARVLSPGWTDWWNLAWSPDGREVWFGASRAGTAAALYAVNLEGHLRELLTAPGTLELQDASRDGRTLVARVSNRSSVFGGSVNGQERDLGWLDLSRVVDISSDGRRILLRGESENAAGYSVVLRDTQGGAAVRLGDGASEQLSPDGKWALARRDATVVALPTGAGQARSRDSGLASLTAARFLPDGRNVLISNSEPDGRTSLHMMDLDGTTPLRPVGEPLDLRYQAQFFPLAISPDGQRVAVAKEGGGVALVPLDGSAPIDLQDADDNDWPIRWTSDGARLYVYDQGEIPARVFAVDVRTGRREASLVIRPRDVPGVWGVGSVVMTADGLSYAYGYQQYLSVLYVVKDLR